MGDTPVVQGDAAAVRAWFGEPNRAFNFGDFHGTSDPGGLCGGSPTCHECGVTIFDTIEGANESVRYAAEFARLHGDRFATVRDYWAAVGQQVEVIDLKDVMPWRSGLADSAAG